MMLQFNRCDIDTRFVLLETRAMSKSNKKRKLRRGKRKLTPEQRRARRWRKQNTQIIFINGKQNACHGSRRSMVCPSTSSLRNADPIWLHQNELWELMPVHDEPAFGYADQPRLDDEDELWELMPEDDEPDFRNADQPWLDEDEPGELTDDDDAIPF